MDAKLIAQRLNKVIGDARKAGFVVIYNDLIQQLIVVTKKEEHETEDLRTLKGPEVDLHGCICGTPVLPQIDSNGNG
ncbi:MAG: hypothetical protein PHX83_07045 [Acidobacteriia bacterium]|nr:hypothetical protein [Terriglobia bacterium]